MVTIFSQLFAGNVSSNSSITTTLSHLLEPVITEHSELVVGDTSKVSYFPLILLHCNLSISSSQWVCPKQL